MDYVIKNKKNMYIRLNSHGTPVTCGESTKGVFEFSKAKNLVGSLPKAMKRLNFVVEPIPEIKAKTGKLAEKKVIENANYVLSEDITRWIDKFGTCADILNEATKRENELIYGLEKVDKDFLDLLHIVEMDKPKDMYGGWQEYKRIKENREERRRLKDELLIIQSVLKDINPEYVQRKRVQKAIDGLLTRKYTCRVIEGECTEESTSNMEK